MQDRPTSFDIAQLAGVSQPTVSRALNGSPRVSEATRRRIIEIARQLNYKVDKNASGLRSQRSRTLALLIFEDPTPDESQINPFFLSMLGSITRACALRGHDLLISFQQESADWHVDYQDSRKADGIILLGYGDYETYRWRLERLVGQGAHFVRWGAVQAGQPGVTIGSDNQQGGREITQHLIALGRRRLAFIGAASEASPEFRDRWLGFSAALREAGLAPVGDGPLEAENTQDAGAQAVAGLLDRGLAFDGVVAASDLLAIGAMAELQGRGLNVPQAVSVTGFDDILAASLTQPPLTTMAQDSAGAGRMLVNTLIDSIGGGACESLVLPTRLVVRRSCGATRPS